MGWRGVEGGVQKMCRHSVERCFGCVLPVVDNSLSK